jgi:dTDP-glucose pyrophosphorylase
MRRAGEFDAALSAEQAAAAAVGHKAMMPVGRPLLEHLLTAVADAGFAEAVLVIGPEHHDVRAHFAAHPARRLALAFVEQAEALGTADAVAAARAACGEAPFVVLNGDTWYPPEAIRAVAAVRAPALGAFDGAALVALGNIPAERLLAFALCDVSDDGWLRDIVEKPVAAHPLAQAAVRRVSMNLWHLPSAIFDVFPEVPVSPRGELELLDAVRLLMQRGAQVAAVPLACGLLDLSTRGDVAAVASRLRARPVAY